MSSSVVNANGATGVLAVKAPAIEDQDFYEVKHTQKGYGAYALKPIKRGTRILAEHPLLRIDQRAYFKADVEAAFAKLSPEDQKRYFELHSAHGQNPAHWPKGVDASLPAKERQRIAEEHEARISKEASIASIFRTNCMNITKGAALFYYNARFNHSCNSNAYFFWNEKIDMETIHAIKDIEAGEELTLCYIDPYQDRARRQWEFKHWGFACDCPACGDISNPESFAAKSADNRYRLSELDDMTSGFRTSPEVMLSNSRMMADMLEMVKLHLVEGFYNYALHPGVNLGSSQTSWFNCFLVSILLETPRLDWKVALTNGIRYRDIGLMCEVRNDLKHAVAAISKALQVVEICCGTDCKEWAEVRDIEIRLGMKTTTLNGGVAEPKLSV